MSDMQKSEGIGVDANLIRAYQEDGVVCLRDAISDEVLKLAHEGIEQNLRSPGKFFRDHTEPGSSHRYLFEYWTWPHTPPFAELIRRSPLGEIAGTLMQANHVHMVMDNWFLREAGARSAAPWHHDEPYFDFEGSLCVIWIPLESAPREDGLTFVRGSHRWGKLFVAPEFSANVPFSCTGDAYQSVPDIDAEREAYDLLSWDVNVGDCLVFDFRTLHCVSNKGAPAKETQRRVTFRFGADNVIFSPRGEWTKETSDFLISHGQHVNSPLGCDIIPQVWTRALSQTNEASVEVRNKQVNI